MGEIGRVETSRTKVLHFGVAVFLSRVGVRVCRGGAEGGGRGGQVEESQRACSRTQYGRNVIPSCTAWAPISGPRFVIA